MYGPVLQAYFKIFFKTIYNTIFSIFYVFIGTMNYKKNNYLLYLIHFYPGFLSQSRHLQIEVGGWCEWFWHLKSSETKKTRKIIVQYARGSVPNQN